MQAIGQLPLPGICQMPCNLDFLARNEVLSVGFATLTKDSADLGCLCNINPVSLCIADSKSPPLYTSGTELSCLYLYLH